MAIFMPALGAAKRVGSSAVCVGNQRSLLTGWILYADDCDGGHFPCAGALNDLSNPGSWTFYDPLASYHNKSSTFGFADGHAERRPRTLRRVHACSPRAQRLF